MKKRRDRAPGFHLLALLLVGLTCILVYSNTLDAPFVFDDMPNITRNPHIRITGLDFDRLYQAGFNGPCPRRPVANISFALNYYADGYDVSGYHVVNIAIHLINGVLVYLLCLTLLELASGLRGQGVPRLDVASAPWVALFSALIFTAHPIQVQSVTYVVQRMNSLAVMFYLSSLLCYVHGRLSPVTWKRWTLFAAGLSSFILALGSKEISAALPAVVLLCEWYFFQDLRTDWLKSHKRHLLALVAVSILIALAYVGADPIDVILSDYAHRDFSLVQRVLTQPRVVSFYVGLVAFPHPSRLNLLHEFTVSRSPIDPITTILALVFVLGLLAASVRLARRHRLVSFCVLWFLLHLVIESSVVGLEMVFEHRLALPMFGVACLAAAMLFHPFAARRRGAVVVSCAVVFALGAASYSRNETWRDEMTLWSDVVSKNPLSHRGHTNLGVAFKDRGRLEEAIDRYREAIRLKPDYEVAHNDLGNALKRQGKIGEAVEAYGEAIRIKPDYPNAHYNLGTALAAAGRFESAVEQFAEVIRMEPDNAMAYNNLGTTLGRLGRLQEAIEHFSEAVRIEPGYVMARHNLGRALAGRGMLDEAIGQFTEAVRIEPDFAEAHYDLGSVLARRGMLEKAVEHFTEAVRIDPGYTEARDRLEYYSRRAERMRVLERER